MESFYRSRIESWESLVARKRRLLADIAAGKKRRAPVDIERIRAEAEQLESLIAFYKMSLGTKAA